MRVSGNKTGISRAGKSVVGWVDEAAVTTQPELAPLIDAWVGTYSLGEAVITLTREGGKVAAVGKLTQAKGCRRRAHAGQGLP